MKSRRKAPTPEWQNIQVDTNMREEGFGEIPKESTYARAFFLFFFGPLL